MLYHIFFLPTKQSAEIVLSTHPGKRVDSAPPSRPFNSERFGEVDLYRLARGALLSKYTGEATQQTYLVYIITSLLLRHNDRNPGHTHRANPLPLLLEHNPCCADAVLRTSKNIQPGVGTSPPVLQTRKSASDFEGYARIGDDDTHTIAFEGFVIAVFYFGLVLEVDWVCSAIHTADIVLDCGGEFVGDGQAAYHNAT